jgi:hypothetical protein
MPTDLSTMGPLPPSKRDESTRAAAGRTAARWSKVRYRQILQLLEERGGLCIFEIAAALSTPSAPSVPQSLSASVPPLTVHDHQISGRFGALEHAGLIQKAGIQRPTPTGCKAEVYQLTLAGLAVLRDVGVPPSGGSNATQITPLKDNSNPLRTDAVKCPSCPYKGTGDSCPPMMACPKGGVT